MRFSKKNLNANISASVRDNRSKFSLRGRPESQLCDYAQHLRNSAPATRIGKIWRMCTSNIDCQHGSAENQVNEVPACKHANCASDANNTMQPRL